MQIMFSTLFFMFLVMFQLIKYDKILKSTRRFENEDYVLLILLFYF